MHDKEAAFLEAILASPDDDTPRLVYADWLEEQVGTMSCRACEGPEPYEVTDDLCCRYCHGTGRVSNGLAERAEFIRVQIDLGSLSECHVASVDDGGDPGGWPCRCRWHVLHRRERELFCFDNIDRWGFRSDAWLRTTVAPDEFARLGRGGISTALVRRGFVEVVTCTTGDFERHVRAIFLTQPIVDVRLSDKEPGSVWGGCCMWRKRFGGDRDRDYIPGWLQPYMGDTTRHPTVAAALAEMSRACVAYGRDKVGLPSFSRQAKGV